MVKEDVQIALSNLKPNWYPADAELLVRAVHIPIGTVIEPENFEGLQNFEYSSSAADQANCNRFGWRGGSDSKIMPGYTIKEEMHYRLHYDDFFQRPDVPTNAAASVLLHSDEGAPARGSFVAPVPLLVCCPAAAPEGKCSSLAAIL